MDTPLTLVFGGRSFPLRDLYLVRELGAALIWRFLIELPSGITKDGLALEAELANRILAGPLDVRATSQADGSTLCPGARVVRVGRPSQLDAAPGELSGAGLLEIVAVGTEAKASKEDRLKNPFLPRRRVHNVTDMAQLFEENFNHVALITLQRLHDRLKELTFPENCSIIQDGVSDWQFFGEMLEQCRLKAPEADWLPLTLVGSASEEGDEARRWLVMPGVKTPYEPWGIEADERRKKEFSNEDRDHRFLFVEAEGKPVVQFQPARYPCIGVGSRDRAFSTNRWRNWRTSELPCFTPGEHPQRTNMIFRIEDHLYRTDKAQIGWETFMFSAPPQAEFRAPFQAFRPHPWVGAGEVVETDKHRPWIKVKLYDFEDSADVAYVWLSTPFSGTDGKKGLHFVPENHTEVAACWSGRFDSRVLLGGNVRSEAAEFASPSVFLEARHLAQYQAVEVRSIGNVKVGSSLSLAINEATNITSNQQLKIHADGADLKLSGGVVYTGR